MEAPNLEELARLAAGGDAAALDSLIRGVKDDVYGLAIRMLWHPQDAEDATQEILIRVVTGLATFEGRSAFRSWVYRIAVRGLLNWRRGRAETPALSFDRFGEDLLDGLGDPPPSNLSNAERGILRREIRIACTQAMLLCLDRDHRMAYLLGEILEMDGTAASDCLEVSPATYRKRLSRARKRVHEFTERRCGLVSEAAPCSCDGRVGVAIQKRRVDPEALLFATHPAKHLEPGQAEAVAERLGAVCDGGELMRRNPQYLAPERVLPKLAALVGQ